MSGGDKGGLVCRGAGEAQDTRHGPGRDPRAGVETARHGGVIESRGNKRVGNMARGCVFLDCL